MVGREHRRRLRPRLSRQVECVKNTNAGINRGNAPPKADRSRHVYSGADISFVQQQEDQGRTFKDNGVQKDIFDILKSHNFNYIRLRIFHNPKDPNGYSQKGYCDLPHTLQMAKRIKAAGEKFLLDFHYSDTWADPGKQFKPQAWQNLSFDELTKAVEDWTKEVIAALQEARDTS